MKNIKKALLICLCVAAIVGATIMGTLAWLTDQSTVKNTMTVGKVDITVDEEKVNPDGTSKDDGRTEEGNEYHLIPGQTYLKDPTMTVHAGSESSYVRMRLTLNCKKQLDAIFAPGIQLTDIFQGYDPDVWVFETETADTDLNTVTYEFRYHTIVEPNGQDDVPLEALFDSFTIPGEVTGTDLESIKDLTITVKGEAIQTLGFDSVDAAWAAFEQQTNG